MNDAPEPIVGNVYGYRAFEVVGERLTSVGLGSHVWTPGTNRARCHLAGHRVKSHTFGPNFQTVWVNDPNDPERLEARTEDRLLTEHGRIPSLTCTCGFYVFKDETTCREEFHHDFEPGRYVLGRVAMAGRAIEHDQGYRVEFAAITAIVTDDPASVRPLLSAYGIDVVGPRTKAEEGLTTAYLLTVDHDRVRLDVPVADSPEVIGWFTVGPDVEIPEPVVRVTAKFTPNRVITEIRVHDDEER